VTISFKGAIVALAILAAPAQATVYDLAADFSNISNPNGVWSFTQGGPLSHYPQPSSGPPNALNAAAANGYWGTGADFFSAPFVVQTTANGSTVGYTNEDFLSGDVLVHGPSDGSSVFVNWTAPSDGVIDLSSSLWYAHSIVTRSQDIFVTLGGNALGNATVTNGIGRSGASSVNALGLSVSAGDVLSFAFSKSAGQQYGSLSGLEAVINFTANTQTAPVPEPASWAMMIGGFALAGGALRRRKMAVSFA
jgi:hypothetical protein